LHRLLRNRIRHAFDDLAPLIDLDRSLHRFHSIQTFNTRHDHFDSIEHGNERFVDTIYIAENRPCRGIEHEARILAEVIQAAIEAATARLRPILMTSFAFIFGLMPLMISTGVGANGNRSIGTGAVGGMLVGTVCGVFVIPVLYIIFETLQEKFSGKAKESKQTGGAETVAF